jgi:hypothetical protein
MTTEAVPDMLPTEAVTVAVPAAMAVSSPELDTVAIV